MAIARTVKEKVLFCPACQAATVDSSALAGGAASCKACKWEGKNEDLLVRDVEHEFSSQDEVLHFFVKDVTLLVASTMAIGLGQMLLKWGFITKTPTPTELGRYARASAIAVATAILRTREKIELENAEIENTKGPANDAS